MLIGVEFLRYNIPAFHEAGFDALITGCAFIAMNYFQIFLEKGKDKLCIELIKTEPFQEKYPLKFVNLLWCKTLSMYSLRTENSDTNFDHVEYFLNTNTFYFSSSNSFSLEEVGQIFGKFGDVNVIILDSFKLLY